jgi:CRP-like cAMP-binding protein
MINQQDKNGLLATLPKDTYQDLLGHLELVSFKTSDVLYRPGEKTQFVYFPRSGIISLLSKGDAIDTLEVAMVGNEGLIGVPVFLGVPTPCKSAIVRTAGTAMRMGAKAFYRYAHENQILQQLLSRYTHALLTEVSQLSVCHRFHSVDMRFARWLLTTQDRLQSDSFTVTQHLIAQRLGVRRAGISIAAQAMQRSKFIRYFRGNVTILNCTGLEAISCGCYRIISAQTI